MICPECGTEIKVYDKCCPKCGKKITSNGNTPRRYRPSGISIFFGIAIILGLFFIPSFRMMDFQIPGLFYLALLFGVALIIYGALRRE